MEAKKHIYYIEYLRLFAMISTVFMHVAADPLWKTINKDWYDISFCVSLAFTAVPLFFMMSGYLVISDEKSSNITVLLKRRLPKLLVPLFAWTIVAVAYKYHFMELGAENIFKELVASIKSPVWVHFWYVYTLAAVYIVSPLLSAAFRVLDKKAHTMIFILMCLPSVKMMLQLFLPPAADKYIEFDLISKLTFFGGHLNTFILGYYIGKLKKKIPNWILILSFIAVFSCIVIGTASLAKNSGVYDQSFQNQSYGFEVLLAAIIFLFFKQNFNKKSAFTKFFPIIPLALSIYFMHNIVLRYMLIHISWTSLAGVLYITFLNILICYFVLKTIASIKPICYLFTGMSFKSACNSCNWIYTYKNIKELFLYIKKKI